MALGKARRILFIGLAVGGMAAAAARAQTPASEPWESALGSDDAARLTLRQYLSERDNATPDRVTRLARDLIVELGRRGATLDTETLDAAVRRVLAAAAAILRSSRVLALGVEDGYRPLSAVAALDFGPDAPPAAGFQRVRADDPRISGRSMTEVRGNGGLIDTGIRGVEKVVLAVPEDSYRVVLLTRGPSRGAIEPFAREVRVNGVSFHITRRASERWISAAILPANDVLRPATRAVETAAGDFAFVHRSRGASENGGAMVLGAHATAGRLTVELGPGTSVRTFVSGMLVERADLPSDLVLGGDAPRHVGPLSDRVGFEQQIAATARRVLERAAAAAARRSVYDLPRPALRPRRG